MSDPSDLSTRISEILRYHGFDPVYADASPRGPHGRCAYTPDGYVCDWEGDECDHAAHITDLIIEALRQRTDSIRATAEDIRADIKEARRACDNERASYLRGELQGTLAAVSAMGIEEK